jgi:hypothetical protein
MTGRIYEEAKDVNDDGLSGQRWNGGEWGPPGHIWDGTAWAPAPPVKGPGGLMAEWLHEVHAAGKKKFPSRDRVGNGNHSTEEDCVDDHAGSS